VDWAGFTLGKKSKGSVECSGGTLYDPTTQHPRYVTLRYGQTWRRGVFTCTSRTSGVTCRNRAGHGLFVSRKSYRLFWTTCPDCRPYGSATAEELEGDEGEADELTCDDRRRPRAGSAFHLQPYGPSTECRAEQDPCARPVPAGGDDDELARADGLGCRGDVGRVAGGRASRAIADEDGTGARPRVAHQLGFGGPVRPACPTGQDHGLAVDRELPGVRDAAGADRVEARRVAARIAQHGDDALNHG